MGLRLIWKVNKGKTSIKYLGHKYNYKFSNNPLQGLRELIKLSQFKNIDNNLPYPTLVGYLGYPMIQFMEQIKLKNKDEINIPDAVMIRPKLVAVFDNIKDTINIMTSIYPNKKIKAKFAYDYANNYIDAAIKKLNKDLSSKTSKKKSKNYKLNFKSNYTKKEYYQIVHKAILISGLSVLLSATQLLNQDLYNAKPRN